jgi:alpha-galactosidase
LALAAPVTVLHSRVQDVRALRAADAPANAVWIDSLDLSKAQLRRTRGQRGQPPPGPAKMMLGGVEYPHGVPLQVNADLVVDLKGAAARFMSMAGIDDAAKAGQGSVTFDVWVDGKHALDSGIVKSGDAPKPISVDLAGAKQLILSVGDAGDGTRDDSAVWGGAMIQLAASAQAKPEVVAFPREPAPPIASSRTSAPVINSPRITGATPGRWFQFLIPASGDRPLTYAAKNLPAGLTLDPKTGIIGGALKAAGRTVVDLTVTGPKGKATGQLTIVGGPDALALTPPLGWNSWNIWGGTVDDAKVRAAADALVTSGLAAQGYTYINIDDAWEGARDANGEITSNEKFPDMKALTDYVHSKGLKIGIYSSPGPRTCQQRFAGSYQHEEQDARTWAKWGFDYIKYDWCSYSDVEAAGARTPLPGLQKPYMLMRGILDKLDRDVVYSLCQYGWGDVWSWGDQVGGNLWRVTGDITDTWASMSGIGFAQTGHEKFAGPGHWNDTDMLVVGKVGWGRAMRDTQLAPNEQMTHITLWSLQAAPLLIGADMSQIDAFTINLLGNPEVLAVNQDPLGQAAGRLRGDGRTDVWARKLSDGTTAVGLFNRAPVPMPISVKWSELGLTGSQPVRDLWLHKDLGSARDEFSIAVPRHGATFVKVGRAR